jgi:hypothetical protein
MREYAVGDVSVIESELVAVVARRVLGRPPDAQPAFLDRMRAVAAIREGEARVRALGDLLLDELEDRFRQRGAGPEWRSPIKSD